MLLVMREELIRDGTRARIGSFGVFFCFFFSIQTQLSTVLAVSEFNNHCKINQNKNYKKRPRTRDRLLPLPNVLSSNETEQTRHGLGNIFSLSFNLIK